jgi:hypothetical protein
MPISMQPSRRSGHSSLLSDSGLSTIILFDPNDQKVSIRVAEDTISIWSMNADNEEATAKIRDQMRKVLRLPHFVSIEYKKHQDSLLDKSSFRNPSIVWRGSERDKGQGGRGGGGRGRGRGGSGRGGSSWKQSSGRLRAGHRINKGRGRRRLVAQSKMATITVVLVRGTVVHITIPTVRVVVIITRVPLGD